MLAGLINVKLVSETNPGSSILAPDALQLPINCIFLKRN